MDAAEIAQSDAVVAPLIAEIEKERLRLQEKVVGLVLTKTGGRRFTIKVDRVDFGYGRLWLRGKVRTATGKWHTRNRDSIRVGDPQFVVEDANAQDV